MIYTLPPLPYASDALEPFMSQETIEYHYGKHLQTYIDNLNRLTEGTPFADMSLEDVVMNSDGSIFNNAAQVWNHTFFFNSLSPDPVDMTLEVQDYLIRDFGSVENFKEGFRKAAVEIFGSGWVWLAQDSKGTLHIIKESNAGNPMRSGMKPLLTIDVWEHAYYIDYRNRRAEFVDECYRHIDWNMVSERLDDIIEVKTAAEEKDMRQYVCIPCGWIYDPAEGDPESGIAPGTPFPDIPDDWTCPACGVGKDYFQPLDQ